MIHFLFITVIILALYFKTYKYNNLMDDHVRREGYLYIVPCPPVPVEDGVRYDDKERSYLATFTNIGTYLATCFVIQLLWGWKVALLYAVMPLNVSGTAWITGNYYMSTVFLLLTSYYFLTLSPWGVFIALPFYVGALESTVSALSFPFFVSFVTPFGWVMFAPLLSFLFGKRFRYGMKIRKEGHEKLGLKVGKFHWRNLLGATNVMAYYIILSTGLARFGFFHTFETYTHIFKFSRHTFLSATLLIVFTVFGLIYDPFGYFWFMLFIGVFSQIMPNYGMFVAERYTYIANVGTCILLGSFLEVYPQAFPVVATVWFMISSKYVRAYKNNEILFSHSFSAFPECPNNYVNYGSLMIEKGRFFDAIKPLLLAEKLCPTNKSKIYVDLANCFAWAKDFSKALDYTRKALACCSPDKKEELGNQESRLSNIMLDIIKNQKKLRKLGIGK